MATLVLNRDSLSVNLESNHLVVHEHTDGGSFCRMPLVDVERVIVVGQPAITFPVFAKLMDLGIPCSFLSHGGRWRGMMDGDSGFHAERRMRQYACVNDSGFALDLVRRTVEAKMFNSRRTVQRLANERGISLVEDESWIAIAKLKEELPFAKTMNSIRGMEGQAANVYFRLLGRFFPPDVPFESRTRRPPRDEANALLSFVYTLLMNVFVATIRAHGLDVAGGFFHRGYDRSPALALDLMEPFRSPWADRLVLDLLNHRRIRVADHFEHADENGVFLNEPGRRIVFKAFDEMMERRRSTERGMLTGKQIVGDVVCGFINSVEAGERIRFFRAA